MLEDTPFWFDLFRVLVSTLLNFHDCIFLIGEQIENSSFIFLDKCLVTVNVWFPCHTRGKEVM